MTSPLTRLNARRLCAAFGLLMLTSFSGCTNIPELDATIPQHLKDADYPKLVRLDGSFSTEQTPSAQAEEIEQYLNARRNRLKQRANRLKNQPN